MGMKGALEGLCYSREREVITEQRGARVEWGVKAVRRGGTGGGGGARAPREFHRQSSASVAVPVEVPFLSCSSSTISGRSKRMKKRQRLKK